ncbi:hypothetical protein B0T24DRAFT_635568 [Lasiosphaeria ovina]|uniref:Uncharacterized protein n=1 Tax=Lasiosphaeria ovina TaxID=92902 RepID=A0AAE0N2T0_9PEZI|nr:hypothetical protein B0T24DRAFT_635568 [Lasiosphaeria ovina]
MTAPLPSQSQQQIPWPPAPPDVNLASIYPFLSQIDNTDIHSISSMPSVVFRFRAQEREHQLQKAAGDCAEN